MIRRRLLSLVRQHSSLLALLLFAILTAVMTWPVVAQLGTHVPGGTVDLWTHRWTYWWIKHAITEGRNPFYTDLLFHPQGVSLAFHNIAWVNIAAWVPLEAIAGGDVAHSLTFLIFCTLNGFSMYLLMREFVDSVPAAFVGGIVYGFWPYMMSQFGHPNMKVTCWVPLTLLYLRRTLHNQRATDAVWAGFFLALTGLTRWQSLVMGGIVIALYLVYRCMRDVACRTWRTLGLLALTGLVAAALMAPLAAPVAQAVLTRGRLDDVLFTDELDSQTDLLSYVVPPPQHPLRTQGAESIYEGSIFNEIYAPFLGYTTLALALYGTMRRWKDARFWLLVVGVYVALALGPQLRINGQLYPGIPMPYRLVGDLFLVRAVRVPQRFNLFLALPIGVLVSLGVADVLQRCASKRIAALVVMAVTVLILREYSFVPYHTEHPVTPDWYGQLAQEPGHFAILDLPIALQTYNKQYMFYQITHRKPLVEGKIARPPREAFAFVGSTPFLRRLHEHNLMDPGLVNVSFQLRTLAEENVRYIVLHKDLASSEQLLGWRDWLTFLPVHEDEDLIVYRTDPRANRDFTLSHNLTEEVGLIRASFSPTNTIQGRALRVDARWGSAGVPDGDYHVCLHVIDASGELAHARRRPLSPHWPTVRWQADEIVRASYALRLPLSLEPGDYSLVLTLCDPSSGSPIGQPADLGPLRVTPLQPTHSLQSTFGDAIQLRGYDLEQSSDALTLTLYWQALREMNTSYKVFVHLSDPASGDVVAQVDAVPRDWTYPTNRWVEGEVLRDAMRLSLEGVGARHYLLTVGCYDQATGDRLQAYTSDGERHPNDAVPIRWIQIEQKGK